MRIALLLLACGLLSGLRSWGGTPAHRLSLEVATGVALPEDPIVGLYVGPAGGTFALTSRVDGARALLVHDGRRWRLTRVLAPDERALPTVGGGLVVADGPRLDTYAWRLRGAGAKIHLGALPAASAVGTVVLRAPSSVDAAPSAIVETGEGVFECSGGSCVRRASRAYAVVGVGEAEVIVYGRGGFSSLRDTATVLASGAWARDAIDPVGVSALGDPVFRTGGRLRALRLSEGRGRARVEDIAAIPEDVGAVVVGEEVVYLRAGRYPSSVSVAAPGRRPERVPASGPARAVGDASTAYVYGGRAVALTQGGLARISPETSAALPLVLDEAFAGVIGAGAGTISVSRVGAVERYDVGADGRLALTDRWPTSSHLMRSSVPTCLAEHDGATFVGTSDGRVLRLTPGRSGADAVEVITSIVGRGTAFTDIHADGDGVWAAYTTSSREQSGLVRITGARAILQVDTAGIDRPVVCVRRAGPAGTLFAATVTGARPLYYFYEEHDVWVALAGAIGQAGGGPLPAVREIAPVSDDLVLLATSRGLYRWRRGRGYDQVPLPEGLLDADVQSVRADGEGCWMAARGRGVYYLAGGELDAVVGVSARGVADLADRCLISAGGGGVLLRDRERLLKLTPPNTSRVPLAPGLLLSTVGHANARARAEPARAYTIRERDSLRVLYGLSGYAPTELQASFSVEGAPLRPVRDEGGVAVFAPLGDVSSRLEIRVASREGAYASSSHAQPVVAKRRWWTTAFGMAVIAGTFALLAGALGGVYSVRQRRLARQLERLVAERTSELQLAERRARRASASKSMFLANMSHEIRTPLNAVLGMSDLLLASPLTAEQVKFAESVQRGGRALHNIVGDVLAFAEIDSGSVRRHDSATALREVIDRALEGPRERAIGKGLSFACETDVPAVAWVDGPKVASILGHLLDNAVKFTEAGGVRVRVVAEAGASLSIRVADTGIGVAPAERARIFEVFEQADNSNTRRFGGTGLGLAIVKTYVECLGGAVAVSAEHPRGACFDARLPLDREPDLPEVRRPARGRTPAAATATPQPTPATAPAEAIHATDAQRPASAPPAPAAVEPAAPEPAAPEVAPAPGRARPAKAPMFFDLAAERPLRILVAEDNAMNKVLILTVLTKLGYRADWAENGRVAVDRFGAGDYDLILMDVHMPEMDGLEATRIIRERHRERPVTICALTANASEEGREDCMAAGMDDFMTKPLQVPRLVELLRGVGPVGRRASDGVERGVPDAVAD